MGSASHYTGKLWFCTGIGGEFCGIHHSVKIRTGCSWFCIHCHLPSFPCVCIQQLSQGKRKELHGDVLPGCQSAHVGQCRLLWTGLLVFTPGFQQICDWLMQVCFSLYFPGNIWGRFWQGSRSWHICFPASLLPKSQKQPPTFFRRWLFVFKTDSLLPAAASARCWPPHRKTGL